MEPVAQSVNLEMGVADYLMNLFTLGGCQPKLAVHPLDYRFARHGQHIVTVKQRTAGEPDQNARQYRCTEPDPANLTRQGRYPDYAFVSAWQTTRLPEQA